MEPKVGDFMVLRTSLLSWTGLTNGLVILSMTKKIVRSVLA